MDESEAIALLRQGDIGALAILVRRYQVRALRAAYLVTGDFAAAEDIVQEAFLRAYQRIDQFDPARSFGPWFLRSVVNDAVKNAARERRLVAWSDQSDDEDAERGPDELTTDPNPLPEELLERMELSETVGEALMELSPPRRAAVVLRYYLGFTEPEIASRLHWPLGTVKRRLHDARRHLRALVGLALRRQVHAVTTQPHFPSGSAGGATPEIDAGGLP